MTDTPAGVPARIEVKPFRSAREGDDCVAGYPDRMGS